MASLTTDPISVLAGPTCVSCESDDLHWGTPVVGVLPSRCRDCGTEYHWYEVPDSECVRCISYETICPICGSSYDAGADDAPFCEDCELSDCAYCGAPTHRFSLSENLACSLCEGEAA
jgi:hypothetical protein